MPTIEVGCDLSYDVRQETIFLFQLAVAKTEHQTVQQETLSSDPQVNIEPCQIGEEGNQIKRIVLQPCTFSLRYRATVELSQELQPADCLAEWSAAQLPPQVLTYLNPSRYCESDLLARFAIEEFGQLDRGFGRVQAICDWVNQYLEYTPGSTTSTTTASSVLLQRTGVCRDYAHLAISLCRSVGIPARYVSGYAVDLQPPDFHGFFEAFLDGNWYLFDPTKLAPVDKLVRIGVGRDAADVSFATITGAATMTNKSVWANVVGEQPTIDAAKPVAVSTA